MIKKVRLVIVPTINVKGYAANKREEVIMSKESLDPNRDFPFNQEKRGKCLITSTSKLLDLIFRDYTVIGALTFHGGDNSITYPWGAYAHEKDPQSGDDIAFKEIA